MIWLILKLALCPEVWLSFVYQNKKLFNIGWAFPVGFQIKIRIGQISELNSNLKRYQNRPVNLPISMKHFVVLSSPSVDYNAYWVEANLKEEYFEG